MSVTEKTKDRLELGDTAVTAVVKMAEGNPGAVMVLAQMFNKGAKIDPDSALGGFGPVLDLDALGIYGSRIWMLYKDVCGEDIVKTLAVLRAHQLGHVSAAQLHHAIDNGGDGLDPDDALAKVQAELPAFGNAPIALE